MRKLFFVLLAVSGLLVSCVPARQFQDEQQKRINCENNSELMKTDNERLIANNTEFQAVLSETNKRLNALQKDTSIIGSSLRTMTLQYDKINDLNKELISQLEKIQKERENSAQELTVELAQAQSDLIKKEDELRKLEASLNAKEASLNTLSTELDLSRQAIEDKEIKLAELQSIIAAQDSAMNSLQNTVANALMGYKDKGITVEKKNGKIYVSMENNLLFASGKWSVNAEGVKALNELSQVLENNPEISIIVEGHTDNVPYNGNGNIEDNWDLSAKRATSIVKILLKNSNIDPQRISAAGRGEFEPISTENSSAARALNRRIEIILTPNLDELIPLLNE